MRTASAFVSLLLISLCLAGIAVGSDWPTYLRDNSRAGWTDQSVKTPLAVRWVYSSPSAPRRAWSGPEGRSGSG